MTDPIREAAQALMARYDDKTAFSVEPELFDALRAALARWDRGKAVREAEREFLAIAMDWLDPGKPMRPEYALQLDDARRALLAARAGEGTP